MTTWTLKKIYHMGDEFTIEWWHDYSWETKTISSWAVTLGLRTIVEPTSNFTLNIPSPLEDGMEYVLRCVNWSTAYTLTLWTWFVNDFNVDLTLHANASDQFTFVSVDWNLELQPAYALEWWSWWWITNDTTGTTTTVTKVWAGTEAEYNALSTKDEHTIYHVY